MKFKPRNPHRYKNAHWATMPLTAEQDAERRANLSPFDLAFEDMTRFISEAYVGAMEIEKRNMDVFMGLAKRFGGGK